MQKVELFDDDMQFLGPVHIRFAAEERSFYAVQGKTGLHEFEPVGNLHPPELEAAPGKPLPLDVGIVQVDLAGRFELDVKEVHPILVRSVSVHKDPGSTKEEVAPILIRVLFDQTVKSEVGITKLEGKTKSEVNELLISRIFDAKSVDPFDRDAAFLLLAFAGGREPPSFGKKKKETSTSMQ